MNYEETFTLNSGPAKAVKFHRIFPYYAIANKNGTVTINSKNNNQTVTELKISAAPVRCLTMHHSLPLLAVGSDDTFIRVYSLESFSQLFVLEGHTDYVRSLTFNSVLPWLLSASDDCTARIWNWQARRSMAVLAGHSNYVFAAIFHPTEMFVLTASLDTSIALWDISSLARTQGSSSGFFSEIVPMVSRAVGHSKAVNCLASSDSGLVASGGDDFEIRLWRVVNNALEVDNYLLGHLGNVTSLCFVDEQTLLSTGEDGFVYWWCIDEPRKKRVFVGKKERVWAIDTNTIDRKIVLGCDKGIKVLKPVSAETDFFFVKNSEGYFKSVFTINDNKLRIVYFGPKGQFFEIWKGFLKSDTKKTFQRTKVVAYSVGNKLRVLLRTNSSVKLSLLKISKSKTKLLTSEDLDCEEADFSAITELNSPLVLLKRTKNQLFLQLDNVCKEKLVDIPFCTETEMFVTKTHVLVRCVTTENTKKILSVNKATKEQFEFVDKSEKNTKVKLSQDGTVLFIVGKELVDVYRVSDALISKAGCECASDEIISAVVDDSLPILYFTTSAGLFYVLENGFIGKNITFAEQKLKVLKKDFPETFLFCDELGNLHSQRINCDEQLLFHFALRKDKIRVEELMKNSTRLFGKRVLHFLADNGCADIALKFAKNKSSLFFIHLKTKEFADALTIAEELDESVLWQELVCSLEAGDNDAVLERAILKTNNNVKLIALYLRQKNVEKLKVLLDKLKSNLDESLLCLIALANLGEKSVKLT